MDDKALKKIEDLIIKTVKPLRDEIAIVNKNVKNEVGLLHPKIDMIASRQEMTNDKLDNLSGALIKIESVLKEYADMYKINKSEIDKIKKRMGIPIVSE